MPEIIRQWFIFILLFHPIEEYYNCNNPSLSEKPFIICDWEEEDYYRHEDIFVLRKELITDNKIKAIYRKKYYEQKNR